MSHSRVFLFAALLIGCAPAVWAQADVPIPKSVVQKAYSAEAAAAGESAFVQNCAFCHGRDTGGGESGPDLTRSTLVTEDVDGDKIGPVIRNGKGAMPRFPVSEQELANLVAFIHTQKAKAESQVGSRRGVDTEDLKTGDVGRGRALFNGTGKCATCHSPTGDLAGVASKYQGLELMRRTLYPRGAKVMLTVTLASGEKLTGEREYQDEFTVALRDGSGTYRSFAMSKVKVEADAPAEAHVAMLPQYTDDNLHDLMTYLLTLQ
ncbi:MAG: c-type cytochrome [Acidobacteria bacterium]|nr:c-type cytochrome [Acidobacteriota bacterium]MDA1234147.1 c-type cytochrome [Acidobacteriota bacterium]